MSSTRSLRRKLRAQSQKLDASLLAYLYDLDLQSGHKDNTISDLANRRISIVRGLRRHLELLLEEVGGR